MLRQHQLRRERKETALKNYDFRFVTRTGEIRNIFLTIDVIAGSGKSVASLMDITAKKQAEEKITRHVSFLQQLLDTIPNPVFYKDARGVYQGCNRAFEEFIGLKKEEILGRSVYDVNPRDLADVYYRADNELFQHPGVQVYETLVKYHDGIKRPVIFNKATYTNPDGSLGGLLGIVVDITDRKKAEDTLAATNRKLQLLSSITRHDILNKITVILAHIRLAKKKYDNPDVVLTLNKLESATKEIRSHIEFSRIYQDLGSHEPRWQALDEMLRRIQVPEGITFTTKDTGFDIYADPLLEKVFYNLMDNSNRHGGNVSAIRLSSAIRSGGLAVIWEDNGVGIPAEEKEQIFLRGYGKQTGLGLFLCREILAISGITITETGTEGKGARFEILIPEPVYRVSTAG
jgi:PAS domain S-box-containing protein